MDTRNAVDREGRYARHLLLEGWDQSRLAAARVMVAGAGAIGNEVIKLLSLVGVGHLLIVDFDTVEISNLARTVLFRESDLGRSKARVAAERAQELNPDVTARGVQADLEYEVGGGALRAMDVVIGCLDSIQARLALNRACLRAGVPWLNGGIEATVGEVALYHPQRGACFECAMSPAMWERQAERFSCGGLQRRMPEEKVPTTAIIASLAASYLANEALALLHAGAQGPKSGLDFSQKLFFTISPYTLRTLELPLRADCLAHETAQPIVVLEESPNALTARKLLRRLEMPEGIVETGFDLLTEMRCMECGQREPILRPLALCKQGLSLCPDCGKESRLPETLSWLDADSPLSAEPLSRLAIPEYAILVVRSEERAVTVQLSGEYRF